MGEIAAGVFRNEMRPPSSYQAVMANLFSRNQGQLIFAWCLAGIALEYLNSCDKLKIGDKSSYVCRMVMQYVASFII